ncbi:MAG: hypothetical protein HZA01_14900 [Nitrospinae bacterium]|nr:hypothetical protein [Nitrospinota bacterium]
MPVKSTNLGYPRIALHRELKKATESYWKGIISESNLQKTAKEIHQTNWKIQKNALIINQFRSCLEKKVCPERQTCDWYKKPADTPRPSATPLKRGIHRRWRPFNRILMNKAPRQAHENYTAAIKIFYFEKFPS